MIEFNAGFPAISSGDAQKDGRNSWSEEVRIAKGADLQANPHTQTRKSHNPSGFSAFSHARRLKKFFGFNFTAWLTVLFLSLILGGGAYAEELTLAWDPNTEPDLDGYTVYYAIGAPGPPYDYAGDLPLDELPDPDNPTVTLTDLDSRVNYYFALTAYDINGNESSFSSSLCVYIDGTVQMCEPASVVDDPVSSEGSGGGGGGGGCFISSSRGGSEAPPFAWFIIALAIIISGSIAAGPVRDRLFSRVPIRRDSKRQNP